MKWTVLIPLMLGLALTACASRKKPVKQPVISTGIQEPVPVTPSQPSVDGDYDRVPGTPVPGSKEDFHLAAGDRVFFGYNQYTLTPEARETLRRQAAWLKNYPAARVRIAGNCDERGTREYNLALGARRAQAAYDYLISLGVSAGRLSTISYGKEQPFDAGASEEAWSVNRNAQTQITSMPQS